MRGHEPSSRDEITDATERAAPAWLRQRRQLLSAGFGAMLLPSLPQVAAARSGPAASPGSAPDLDDPARQLRAYVRMRGSSDDRRVIDLTQGFVYALLPGGRPRLLWQSRGFQVSRYRADANGAWTCHSNYFGTLADPASGAPLDAWDNPFTRQRDTPEPTLYGPMDYVLTATRTLVNPTPAQRAAALAERATRRWTRLGDLVTILDELGPPDDPSKPPDFDMVSISARAGDLADESLASVPSQTSFGAVEPWRPWMRMGSRPGMLLWHLQGTKVGDIAQVPEVLLRRADERRKRFVAEALK